MKKIYKENMKFKKIKFLEQEKWEILLQEKTINQINK